MDGVGDYAAKGHYAQTTDVAQRTRVPFRFNETATHRMVEVFVSTVRG